MSGTVPGEAPPPVDVEAMLCEYKIELEKALSDLRSARHRAESLMNVVTGLEGYIEASKPVELEDDRELVPARWEPGMGTP